MEFKDLIPLSDEVWKDIEGYEGLYQISNFGVVKSLDRPSRNWRGSFIIKSQIIKQQKAPKGYYSVSLCKNSVKKRHLVHRLLMMHFSSNPENKPCINHIDGNGYNNDLNNLEWCSHKENTKHAFQMGLRVPTGWAKDKMNKHTLT